MVRLFFDAPVRLQRVRLAFREGETAPAPEFVQRWSPDGGAAYREVVRRQSTFSPPRTAEEIEGYRVELDGATAVELRIVPRH